MKFAANKSLEGQTIELERVKNSTNGRQIRKRKTIRQMFEEIQSTLNLCIELFIDHGWLKVDPKTGKLIKTKVKN